MGRELQRQIARTFDSPEKRPVFRQRKRKREPEGQQSRINHRANLILGTGCGQAGDINGKIRAKGHDSSPNGKHMDTQQRRIFPKASHRLVCRGTNKRMKRTCGKEHIFSSFRRLQRRFDPFERILDSDVPGILCFTHQAGRMRHGGTKRKGEKRKREGGCRRGGGGGMCCFL